MLEDCRAGKGPLADARMGKMRQPAGGAEYLLSNTAGRERVMFRDELPNIGNVLRGEGMKGKALLCAH